MIENLSSTKEELEGIKQEGENIKVGYETKKGVKYWAKKGALIGALALTLTATSSYMPVNTTITAEAKAKKDTKKPTLKFKGKTTMTAEKGKNITIPKVTAKDNKDGNITKKIQVSVKKGTKNYASLAKKIKNGKNVKFSDIGKYVITYTVKDKAGNKTTKKRYVNVILPKTKTTEDVAPYVIERPSTTQAPVTTEAPVTTQTPPTTENPYLVAPKADLSKYGDIEEVTVNGVTYNVARELYVDFINFSSDSDINYEFSNFTADSNIPDLKVAIGNNSPLKNTNPEYLLLYFLGKPSLQVDNIDLTNNMILYPMKEFEEGDTSYSFYNLFVDANGNLVTLGAHSIYYGDHESNKFQMYNWAPGSVVMGVSSDDTNEIVTYPHPKTEEFKIDEVNAKLVFKP